MCFEKVLCICMQVVANPFIWSRLNRPGQPVPFLFDEFKPAETAAADALQPEASASRVQTGTGPAISAADALHDLMDIVKGMLGSQVCAQHKPLLNLKGMSMMDCSTAAGWHHIGAVFGIFQIIWLPRLLLPCRPSQTSR